MKFLHLADLHIGKRVRETSMIPEQKYILKKLLDVVEEEKTDGVFIAGDIYDKSVPTIEAVTLFDGFLNGLSERGQEVFIVAGNHDSAERLSFASDLLKNSGIHISHVYTGDVRPVEFIKGEERVDVTLLPFIRPANVRACFQDEKAESYSDAVKLALSKIRLDERYANIIVTHQFVTGSVESGSEEMTVGGINNVDYNVFAPFDYVALGHVHKRQSMLGGRIHYPGTPIKYSVEEAAEQRTCSIVEVDGKRISHRFIPLIPLHDLREIKGEYKNILRESSEDYVYITLTDSDKIPDAVRELRKKYPNLMNLSYDIPYGKGEFEYADCDEADSSPMKFIEELFRKQNDAEMSEKQRDYIFKMIQKIWQGEDDESIES